MFDARCCRLQLLSAPRAATSSVFGISPSSLTSVESLAPLNDIRLLIYGNKLEEADVRISVVFLHPYQAFHDFCYMALCPYDMTLH